jgi:phage tail-like protein
MSSLETNHQESKAPLSVSHCADFGRRYPGEKVTFYTRVEIEEPLPGFTLRVTVPAGLTLGDYRPITDPDQPLPLVTWDQGTNHLTWQIEQACQAGDRYEYLAQAQVNPAMEDQVLLSRALVRAEEGQERSARAEETAAVAVLARAKALRYLPAIYSNDELMGRFLMLFESFWTPIDRQIDSLPHYFDAQMTPSEFLPWLASWVDLVLDEQWPEAKRRHLLQSAMRLFRKRGTRQGLVDYVEIYTDQRPEIVEHRAQNFHLGPTGQLGQSIALGTDNVPHTFTVNLKLPPLSAMQPTGEDLPEEERERHRQETARREAFRRHKIETIIEAQKPAHTRYNLHVEVDPELAMSDMREKT